MVLLGLIAARPAAAEPQTEASPKSKQTKQTQKPDQKPEAKTDKAGKKKPASAGFGLGSMAEMAANAAARPGDEEAEKGKAEARRLDLTPRAQLESGKLGTSADRRGTERGRGLTLGDDTDWKVQAMQVGAMAAVFTTLVAVCGNGRCLLPELFGGGGQDELGPAPGVQTRDQPKLRDPR